MERPVRSRRGVYYDLTESPYEYTSPYGDSFRFASQKKLDMYTRDVKTELERVEKVMEKTGIVEKLPAEILQLIRRAAYQAYYCKFED